MDTAETNLQIFNDYEGELSKWRLRSDKLTKFFNGQQYSKRVESELRQMGLNPIVINIVRPLLLQILSIITSSKPTWRVVPLQGASKEVADICGKYLVGKWNSDYVDIQLAMIMKDMLTTGLGWMFVDRASFLDNAIFDIIIKRINWKYVYPDPQASEFDFSDAENIIIRKPMSGGRAKVQFQMTEREVQECFQNNPSYSASQVSSGWRLMPVDVIDRFSKYPVQRWDYEILPRKDGGRHDLRDLPPTIFYTSDLKNKIERERKDYIKELKGLQSEGKVEVKNMRDLHIYRCISVGMSTRYEGVMNVRDYPTIPFTYDFWDEAKTVSGEASPLEGIQEALNKFYMLTLYNALLTGNVKIMAPETAIDDITKFQKTWATPGVPWTYKPDPTLPDGGKPTIIQPGQLSSAFYGLSSDLKRQAEYQAGVFGPLQGNAQESPETFSTVSSLQNFGAQRIKFNARKVDIQLAKAGEVVIQYIQNYAPRNEMLTYIDDRAFNERGEVNAEYGQVQQAGMVNEEEINDMVVDKIKNDVSIGKMAIKVLTQPNLGTDRMMKASFMSSMIMNKALPPTPAVMKKLFDLMEVPGYMEIVKEMEESGVNQEKLQQLMQQLQVLGKQNKVLQDEAMTMAKKLEIKDFDVQLQKQLLAIKEQASKSEAQREKLSGDAIDTLLNQGNDNG